MKLNLFITGSSGLLGKKLLFKLKKKKIKFIIFERKEGKKYKLDYFEKIFKNNNFTHIINLAAFTNVDLAEKQKEKAKEINLNFLKKICISLSNSKKKIKLIHLSTDQMYYDYKKNNEKKNVIKNYYTYTKIQSEKIALKQNSLIFRTNFFGRSLDKKRMSFSDWIYLNNKNNKNIYLADDLYFSPLSMDTLCEILVKVLPSNNRGIYNLGANCGKSRYIFGILFAKLLGLDLKLIKKVKMKDLNLCAKRNRDMRMIVKKFEKDFKIKLPSLNEEIKKVSKDYL